jgi:hypothetical protein
MRTAAKVLALALLLALKPACGGGGGGGGTPGPLVLPDVVPSLPLDSTAITTTINVNTQSDGTVQTLLQAALDAGGKIVLTNNGTPRTITLSPFTALAPQALIVHSSSGAPKTVILDGSGDITLSGGGSLRIMDLQDRTQLTVQRMNFTNAKVSDSGAAINNDGTTTTVRLITLIDCNFDTCVTTSTGPDIGGGAVRFWNGQHTQISGCTFTNCQGSNGGAVNSLGTRLTIINSTFTTNTAFGTGGGSDTGGSGGIGGAVYVDNVSNDASALHQLSITGCTFTGNQSNAQAGAVFGYTNPASPSTTIIDRCTFTSNKVNTTTQGFAGAIYSQAGTLTLSNSTLSGNHASTNGGALDCENSSTLIANCTFQGNTAGSGTSGLGGAIFATAGNVSLVNDTLSQNKAFNFSGGLHSVAASTSVQNCIFDSNTIGTSDHHVQLSGSFGVGNNLQVPVPAAGDVTVNASGTTVAANAMLTVLQNNGGPTFTMQPLAGSPAIGLATSGAPATDQRGMGRNGTPDAGACEGP